MVSNHPTIFPSFGGSNIWGEAEVRPLFAIRHTGGPIRFFEKNRSGTGIIRILGRMEEKGPPMFNKRESTMLVLYQSLDLLQLVDVGARSGGAGTKS